MASGTIASPRRGQPRARQLPQRRDARNVVGHPVFAAMNAAPAPDADLQPLRLGELLALIDFEAGRAGARAWHDLDDMARVAAELAAMGIGAEVLPLARDALRVLHTAVAFDRPMRIDAAGLVPLRELQEAHDRQRLLASRAEFIEANVRAIAALRAGGSRLSVPAALQEP